MFQAFFSLFLAVSTASTTNLIPTITQLTRMYHDGGAQAGLMCLNNICVECQGLGSGTSTCKLSTSTLTCVGWCKNGVCGSGCIPK